MDKVKINMVYGCRQQRLCLLPHLILRHLNAFISPMDIMAYSHWLESLRDIRSPHEEAAFYREAANDVTSSHPSMRHFVYNHEM